MAFVPLDDDAPRLRIHRPWVNWGLLAACLVGFWAQSLSDQDEGLRLIYALGVLPATLTGAGQLAPDTYLVPPFLTLISYQFLHGGFAHLIGNMLYLWVFGDNVEDAMGHGRYLAFFLICGILAALAQVIAAPESRVPLIGASGAISGVLGAYLILHPKAKVLVPIFFIPINLPAWLLLVFWIAFQVFSFASNPDLSGGGTAWLAHIGGFLAGAILVFVFRHPHAALFGSNDLPSGITLRDKVRWQSHRNWRPGPWER